MRLSIESIPLIFLLLLPVLASFFKQRFFTTLIVWAVFLVTYFALRVKFRLFGPGKKWKLASIGPSHFCEKIRWCLQYCGIDHDEEFDAGILGIFLFQRTVPILTIPRKRVSIGNSSDILRYVYGHVCGDPAYSEKVRKFLEPTPEAVELEKKLDEMGTAVQVVIYDELLKNKQQTMQGTMHFFFFVRAHALNLNNAFVDDANTAWLGTLPNGSYSKKVPWYQSIACTIMYPAIVKFVRIGLKITPKNVQKQLALIKDTVKLVEEKLNSDGRKYLLGTDKGPTFIDFTFASLLSHFLVNREVFANGECKEFLLSENEKKALKLHELALQLQQSKAGEFVQLSFFDLHSSWTEAKVLFVNSKQYLQFDHFFIQTTPFFLEQQIVVLTKPAKHTHKAYTSIKHAALEKFKASPERASNALFSLTNCVLLYQNKFLLLFLAVCFSIAKNLIQFVVVQFFIIKKSTYFTVDLKRRDILMGVGTNCVSSIIVNV
ncbi:hypothetical protein RFI_01714 [Reticulomyxa filosa]|uniref:Uncharacterized protein n=1 Tax=Reticulomyxa filosa TaxID=46433 RepID=X6PBA7_RETFI|nr:hypothetical protein RFI_01714 [Reticulomyxa filosa]|eukprot:ETO35349.1 hypothetical protein RFI_01714 [Reticulomyxa filosa]